MLNEIGEYEQYATASGFDDHRLKYFTLIKKNFSGLERALTIIAREKIFGEDDAPKNFEPERIKNYLRAWCGFPFDGEVEPRWVNRLPEYIRQNFLKSCVENCRAKSAEFPNEFIKFLEDLSPTKPLAELKIAAEKNSAFAKKFSDCKLELGRAEKIIAALEELQDKAEYFDKKIFGTYTANGKNDYRLITFERVIANALVLGRLKKFFLVCHRDPFQSFEIRKFTESKPAGKKLLAANEDLILKLTAMYLVQKKFSDQKFVPLNNMNLVNWLWKDTKPEDFDLEQFKFARTEEKIFELRHVGGVNVNKFCVCEEWLKNFYLAEEFELERTENRGRIFFGDSGRAVPLARNIL